LELVLATAQAGEMLGNKMIYLEAGSGAQQSVPVEMIDLISKNTEIPLIVGGGIVDLLGIKKAHDSGADIVVIGTAFERDIDFFESAEKCLIKNK
jgi:putative glycerol-1-phosphate prenyltransferase